MKIVAGLGSIDHYKDLAEAGADEVFCGVVPYEWNKKYGSLFPLNRREVLYYNVQICSLEEMKILKKMMDVYKVPVNITFNYLYYLEEQYEMIYEIMKELINIGFDEFIIADISLILYLNKRGLKCNIHLSGECAEINRLSIDFFNQLNISRYIFHRKNTIEDIKRVGATVGIEASAIDGVLLNNERISSTKIREYLSKGQLDLAKQALGRYYSMSGIVVHGNQIGRTLGFPTANVNINRKVTPLTGVYAVKVLTKSGIYNGMANVGYRPTVVTGQKNALLEVNLFDFNKDLYAQSIRVFFIEKIRDEVKFNNLEVLKEQLLHDRNCAKEFFDKHPLAEF